MEPIFIDFEASSIQGYPVQVAYGSCEEDLKCFLIKPLEVWEKDDYLWDFNAQDIHGFSLNYLREYGLNAVSVAKEVSNDLQGKTIYSDSKVDLNWLYYLLDDVADITGETYPAPKHELIQHLIWQEKIDPYLSVKAQMMAKEKFLSRGLEYHKADNDTLLHIWTWKALQELLKEKNSV